MILIEFRICFQKYFNISFCIYDLIPNCNFFVFNFLHYSPPTRNYAHSKTDSFPTKKVFDSFECDDPPRPGTDLTIRVRFVWVAATD